MRVDYSDLNSTDIYKLMSNSVVPRPIAWIITEDDGIINIAPFSYFIPLSSKPPVVIVSIGHKEDGTPKDTLFNIRKTKKATICFVDEEHLEDMNKTALSLPKEEGEAKKFGIVTKKVLDDFPSVIADVESAMFCEFFDELDLGGKTVPVLLEVKHQYFKDGIVDESFNFKLGNIARVGKNYARLEDI